VIHFGPQFFLTKVIWFIWRIRNLDQGEKMKTLIVLIFIILAFSGCKKNEETSTPTDPVFGTWIYVSPASTSTTSIGLIGLIDPGGDIQSLSFKLNNNGGLISGYVRKNIGKWTRSGDVFTVKYSYETCTPVGTESFTMKISDTNSNVLYYTKDTLMASFNRSTGSSDEPTSITLIEDTACDKF